MFNNIEKYRNVIKMASSTTDTGYEAQGYTTTTPNGTNATVYNIVDTHDEYEKKILVKIEDYHDYDEYLINYEDVYHAFKNNTVKFSEDNLFYKNCVSTNHDDIILKDELIKYITKCLNINSSLTLEIVQDIPGTSTNMKIQAFNTMIRLVEKNQEVVERDNLLEDSIKSMDDYIQSLDN